jgi:gamma-glutamyltranspeptidase / glutathione hydrolase
MVHRNHILRTLEPFMLCSRLMASAAGLLLTGLTGCSLFGLGEDTTAVAPTSGYVVGDEPLAVETGASILAQGGSAADAATAMYFAMAATYPVAAGLGGGGLCVVRDPASSRTEAIDFLSRNSAGGGAFGVPGNVRGFSVLQQSYGRLPWQRDVAPGEGYASTGFAISQALEIRLLASQNMVRLDASLAAEFLDESGKVKPAGARASNPDLGATLSALRIFGPNALYSGKIADQLVAYSSSQGGAFKMSELEGYPVDRDEPAATELSNNIVYLPPERVGAGAFVGAFLNRVVDRQGQIRAFQNPTLAIAQATKATLDQFGIKSLPRDLGATGFAAVDNTGQAAACAVTLNGAFGSGHTATNTGVVLSRAPSSPEAGLSGAFLSPAIVTASGNGPLVLAGVGAGGPNGTAAVIYALTRIASGQDISQPGQLHSTGIAPFDTLNVIACQNDNCEAIPDPGAKGLGAAAE